MRQSLKILVSVVVFVLLGVFVWPSQAVQSHPCTVQWQGIAQAEQTPEPHSGSGSDSAPPAAASVTATAGEGEDKPVLSLTPQPDDKQGAPPVGSSKFPFPFLNSTLVILLSLGLVAAFAVVLALLIWGQRRKNNLPSRPHAVPKNEGQSAGGPYLLWEGHARRPQRFKIGPEGLTLGRAPDNTFVIGEAFQGWETVSRHHARIYRQGPYWMVEDLNSRNGVYVDGQRTGRNLLYTGCTLAMGSVVFRFSKNGEARE